MTERSKISTDQMAAIALTSLARESFVYGIELGIVMCQSIVTRLQTEQQWNEGNVALTELHSRLRVAQRVAPNIDEPEYKSLGFTPERMNEIFEEYFSWQLNGVAGQC